jgi:hypothetical protein
MQASGQIEDLPSSSVKWSDSQHTGGRAPGAQKSVSRFILGNVQNIGHKRELSPSGERRRISTYNLRPLVLRPRE